MNDNKAYKISAPGKASLGLSELREYKELFFYFTWRDIKVKYKQSVLGFAWAILQPLFMMVIMTVFFGSMLKIENETGSIPYPVFVFSGLLFWGVFSTGLAAAGNSMVSNSNIIKKIYFPRLIIPMSAILVSVFDFLMASSIFILLLIYYQFTQDLEVNWPYLLLATPVCLVITTLATFGIGVLIAALNVKYRDFRYIIPFLIQTLLFLTPVIYPISMLQDSSARMLLALNPMYAPITLIKNAITATPIEFDLVALSLLSNLFFLLIGVFYFRKTEAYFADIA